MKNFIICMLLSVINLATMNAQKDSTETKIGKFGVSFSSFGGSDLFPFQSIDGNAGYDSKGYFAVALNYVRDINRWLDFETGIEYAKYKMATSGGSLTGVYIPPQKFDVQVINIPLTVRANFWNYFFANGGLLVDIDVTKNRDADAQNGLGAMMGIGGNYDFPSGVSVFVNPYVKVHSLLHFGSDNIHYRLGNVGVRLGVMYNFR